jgi:hypothetical protein
MPSTFSSPAAGHHRSRRFTARLSLPTSSVASAGVDTACKKLVPNRWTLLLSSFTAGPTSTTRTTWKLPSVWCQRRS